MLNWKLLVIALALVFVLEGIMPFLCPDFWRKMLTKIIAKSNKSLRIMGFSSMLFGVIVLFVIHHHLL